MAPSTLDLFVLTFNCAKNLIDPDIFASHLHAALSQNATGLPDLVVFSLQEVAPLSYSFIGPYFLSPYYARYGEALNLASARVLASVGDGGYVSDSASSSAPDRGSKQQHYTLVRAKNVGMTAILLYARDPASVHKIEEAECGFGAADMGNKGAVGLRVTWGQPSDDGGLEPEKTTELTFVAAHLAAMEWNLKKRNANWRSIVAGLTFANPRAVLPDLPPRDPRRAPTPDRSGAGDLAPLVPLPTGESPEPSEEETEPEEDDVEDTQPLLPTTTTTTTHKDQLSPTDQARLQALSIYKPTSHLFVAGDLNYRIASTAPPPHAAFPSFDPSSEHFYPKFLPQDQLTRERCAGRALHGLSEAEVGFGPTYKFDVLPFSEVVAGQDGGDNNSRKDKKKKKAVNEEAVRRGERVNGVAEVPWRFAGHRWPGWCDRVLYLDVPRWVTTRGKVSGGGGGKDGGKGVGEVKVVVTAYDALPVVATSDHRAVFFRARVPVLREDEMMPPLSSSPSSSLEGVLLLGEGGEEEGIVEDPRLRMPVPVDVHAWERRAAARRKELLVGWSVVIWSTREGAVLLATLLAFGLGTWWLWRMW
ncbi:DNase I-like protein [Parathielavia hyrcaniae]|uniref:DNase I-like protein n=1 Tax=Parathielavia hyrcaniae TaxID=113614 RepID=A0AAN6T316_9PEZI|nr:DNase I-like protein [Parathielavia hyrcaniae]